MDQEPKIGRPRGLLKGVNRNIRLTDAEWGAFKELLGVEWLRKRIASAIKRQNRQPIVHSTKE